jgi:hypothetical protein
MAKEVTIVDHSQTDSGETVSLHSDADGRCISSANAMNEPHATGSVGNKEVGTMTDDYIVRHLQCKAYQTAI